MSVEIVSLTPERVDEAKRFVEAVWREHFSSHRDPYVRDFLTKEKLSDIDDFQSEYAKRDGIFLLILETETIVGTGAIRRVDATLCELTRMFVKRSHRRSGLGTRLAAELLAWARKRGYRHVRLASNKQLLPSHRLYTKLGFGLVRSWDRDEDTHSLYFTRDL